MKLTLVRHPRPDIAPGLCYGASDVPVAAAECARVQAKLAAAGLPGALPVYASPLRRCAQLALAVAPAGVTFDARLMEMDFGSWEMQPWSAIAHDDVDAWAADLLAYRPGGGENVIAVARRVAAFAADLHAAAVTEALIIGHAGTIRLLTALAGGLPLEQAALTAAQTPHRVGHGEIVMLEYR